MPDAHANFAFGTVLTPPSPATSGATLVLDSGQGASMPAVPFNVTICPIGALPSTANAEIARCTARSTDTLTIVRAQEGTAARTVIVGDLVSASITAKTVTDIEAMGFDAYALADAAQTLSASTVMQNDARLKVTIGSSATEVWAFEYYLEFGAPNTVMDLKLGWSVPTSAAVRWGQHAAGSGAYGPYIPTGTPGAGANDESSVLGFDLAAINFNPIFSMGTIRGGGTAGDVTIQWAQRTSDAGTLTRQIGSWFRAKKIKA